MVNQLDISHAFHHIYIINAPVIPKSDIAQQRTNICTKLILKPPTTSPMPSPQKSSSPEIDNLLNFQIIHQTKDDICEPVMLATNSSFNYEVLCAVQACAAVCLQSRRCAMNSAHTQSIRLASRLYLVGTVASCHGTR